MIDGFHVSACLTSKYTYPYTFTSSVLHQISVYVWKESYLYFYPFRHSLFCHSRVCTLLSKFAHLHEMQILKLKLFHEVLNKICMADKVFIFRIYKSAPVKVTIQKMAEKFCNQFGSGPHHLKIGKSFEKKSGNSVFHSIR